MTGRNAIKNAAKLHGQSETYIRRQIRECMEAAMKNPDPKIRAVWASIPRKGKELTEEEFIQWAAGQIKARTGTPAPPPYSSPRCSNSILAPMRMSTKPPSSSALA